MRLIVDKAVWLLALYTALWPITGLAETTRFDILLGAFKIGNLAFASEQRGTRHVVSAKIQSTGTLGQIRPFRYAGRSDFVHTPNQIIPRTYQETADTGQRQSEVRITYTNGVPKVERYWPTPGPDDPILPSASQRGTVDPLTAVFLGLRDQPEAELCTLSVTIFDGKRRSQLDLNRRQTEGTDITCHGRYQRLQGFTEKAMKQKSVFDIAISYGLDSEGLYQAKQMKLETLYGPARLIRR